ncbi:MAG TPA: VOC family protein [Chloroflexota bacterium]|nr:VOC family protein [Chloroflexota bacterium]
MNTTAAPKMIWPCLNYRDAHAAIAFLTDAFGFVKTLVVDGGAERAVAHAELRFPEGGGVMLGSASGGGNEFERLPTGSCSVYVATDEPDALFERATRAGATVVRGLEDTDYGSRGFTVRDLEGNLWSFGTYRGE